MLAKNAVEQVIIEVRTQESITDEPKLDAIARALQNRVGWRFELVVTNPRERSPSVFKNAASLDYNDIAYRLGEAKQLSEQEHGEAAFLLAWSATEALLRTIADREDVPAEKTSPAQLMKSLFTYGVLDREQYHLLQEGFQARNVIVHGYKEQRPLTKTLDGMLSIASQLARRYSSA